MRELISNRTASNLSSRSASVALQSATAKAGYLLSAVFSPALFSLPVLMRGKFRHAGKVVEGQNFAEFPHVPLPRFIRQVSDLPRRSWRFGGGGGYVGISTAAPIADFTEGWD